MRVEGVSPFVERTQWLPLAWRCVFACGAMSLGFYAIQQMVLADASSLVFMSPIMTFFLVRRRSKISHKRRITCAHRG